MTDTFSSFQLSRWPVSARLVASLFSILMGIGYLVSLLHMYNTYASADGKPGLSAADLDRSLRGQPDRTVLTAAISGGPMEQYLTNPGDKERLLAWVHAGAREAQFGAVQPILQKSCVGCHNSQGAARSRPLTTFPEVAAVTQADHGESAAALARVAHIHLQSLAMIYLALGLLFCCCGFPERLKAWVVTTPFLALVGDFGARGLTHAYPWMVYVVMLSGAAGGLTTAVMTLGVLWEAWVVGRARHEPRMAATPASNGLLGEVR